MAGLVSMSSIRMRTRSIPSFRRRLVQRQVRFTGLQVFHRRVLVRALDQRLQDRISLELDGVRGCRRARRKRRRSEEHTSELQSREKLVCRLLLEKKKIRRL